MAGLNAMFNQEVNAACNNAVLSRATIRAMAKPTEKSSLHPSMRRLYEAAREHGDHQQADVARKLNISQQRLNNWDARGISKEGALAAQRVYGVSANWLRLEGDDALSDAASDWADILGVRQAAALGDGALADEYAETHKLKFRSESLRRKHLRPEKLAVLYGRGDSMQPTIKTGDAILFDTSDTTPQDGKIYVIQYDGHLMAKRLIELGGKWFIDSDNKTDPKWRKPQAVDETKDFAIYGRVRWIGSWED